MIRNNGNISNISNRNFAQMLEEINFNLSSFPLTSLNNGNNGGQSSSNARGQERSNGLLDQNNQLSSYLLQRNNESSSQQAQQIGQRGGDYHIRYQFPQNNQYESFNNYGRNRDNNSMHRECESIQSQNIQLNNTRKKQNSSPKIQDILTCFICFGKLKNAHMCPDCQKMCCEECIKEWLSNKSQCPHCRSHLRPSKLMKCRFVSEITTALEKIEQIEQKKEKQGMCQEHENPLQYYCQICKHPVCSDCGMIGSKHKNHRFEKLNVVYDSHVNQVKQQLTQVQKKLIELNRQKSEINQVTDTLSKIRDEKYLSLSEQMDHVNMKLNDHLKSKLDKFQVQKGPIQEEIDMLEGMSDEINHHIETLPKSMLINKSEEIVKTLEEINNRKVIKNYICENDRKLEFQYDIIPPYDSADFFLENYSVKKKSSDVAYSDTFTANGNEWRLKVYLNGKDKAKDNYLSVFVEMTKGSMKDSNYEYRVEMINQINPDLRVTREFISPFKTGDTWGYERFFKLDQLEQEGYLLPESDMLILKYYVRSPSYSQFCQSKQSRIDELEYRNLQLIKEIKSLQENKQQNQTQLSQGELLDNPQQKDGIKLEEVNESKAFNFELETFINEIENGNISNIRSDYENYLKRTNLEEFEKSDQEDQQDDEASEEDEEHQEDDENEKSQEENSSQERDDESESGESNERDNEDEDYQYENEEDIYEYKSSTNYQNEDKHIIDKLIEKEDHEQDNEFEMQQNNSIKLEEYANENINLEKRKLKKKEEIQFIDKQFLNEDQELNNIVNEIQELLKQESDKTCLRQNFDSQQENNRRNELDELDLYCKIDEEDRLNQSNQVRNNEYDLNTNSQNINSKVKQQIDFSKDQLKSRDQEISAILQGNHDKLSERFPQKNNEKLEYPSQNTKIDSTSNFIKSQANHNTKFNDMQSNKQSLENEITDESQFEENKCMDDNNINQNAITQDSGISDIYMCLDEIGDKVQFLPLNQVENLNLVDSSILVKKNLLPEFEQEALRLQENKVISSIQEKYQKEDLKNIQSLQQLNPRVTAPQVVFNLSQSQSNLINQQNTYALQKAQFLELNKQQASNKNKYHNSEEQNFQITKPNTLQTVNSVQDSQKLVQSINANKFFKESGNTTTSNITKGEGLYSSRYDTNNQKNEQKNNVFNLKNDMYNYKNEDLNNLKSDRLYTYQVNSTKVDGKEALQFETQSYKYNIKNKDADNNLTNSTNEYKGFGETIQNSISSQISKNPQIKSKELNQKINSKEDHTILGTFSNPTLSKLLASHSQQNEQKQDNLIQSQNKNSIAPGLNQSLSVSTNNSNLNRIIKMATDLESKYNSEIQDKTKDEEDEETLEKENKDDSLLEMEKQIQKLEMMNKLEEDQKLSYSSRSQRVLQTKDMAQQQVNIPSQQYLNESRKLLISQIGITDDLIKKINKVKSYNTNLKTQNTSINNTQKENNNNSSNSSNSQNTDPASNMKNDASQQKNSLLNSLISDQNIQQKQQKEQLLNQNSSQNKQHNQSGKNSQRQSQEVTENESNMLQQQNISDEKEVGISKVIEELKE